MLYSLPLVSCPIDASHCFESSVTQGSNDTLFAAHANGPAELIGRGRISMSARIGYPCILYGLRGR